MRAKVKRKIGENEKYILCKTKERDMANESATDRKFDLAAGIRPEHGESG
jgi:hypothetical protein